MEEGLIGLELRGKQREKENDINHILLFKHAPIYKNKRNMIVQVCQNEMFLIQHPAIEHLWQREEKGERNNINLGLSALSNKTTHTVAYCI